MFKTKNGSIQTFTGHFKQFQAKYSTYSVNILVPVYALFHMFIHTISDKIRPLQAVLIPFQTVLVNITPR